MNLTRTSYIRLLRIVVAVLIVLVIVIYAIWRSLNYARGPAITITSPVGGSSVDSDTIEIKGRVDRANNLAMNGQSISVDQQGNFDQTLIAFPGTNILTFVASDQFGRSVEKELNITGTVDFRTLPTSATASSSDIHSTSSKL